MQDVCDELSIATAPLETIGIIVFCYVLVNHNELWYYFPLKIKGFEFDTVF